MSEAVEKTSGRRRIDVHHHILPPAFQPLAREAMARESSGFTHVLDWTPQRSLDEMDRWDVATAITSISTPGMWYGDPAKARDLARACNDYAARMASDHPGRFGIFAAMPLPDIDACLREIEYALDTLKADGVGFVTSYGDKWPGDPVFAPLFDELNRRGATAYFHPTTPLCCRGLMPGIPAYAVEFAFDTARAVTSLLYNGVLSRCANMSFIFTHDGGALPMVAGRLDRLAQFEPRLAQHLPKGAMHELRRLYFDVATSTNPPALAALKVLAQPDHIVFGSDYPFVAMEGTIPGLLQYGFSETELRAIERDNAAALFPRFRC